jgi:hypothetical protein
MRPSASKLLVTVALAVSSSLLSAAAGSGQPRLEGKKLPYDSSPDAVEAVRQLQAEVGLDIERQVLLRPYEETAVNTLVDGLRSPFDEVKAAALDLLALAVKQLDIPEDVLRQTIMPAAAVVEERYRGASAVEEVRLSDLARRVLWQARVKMMASDWQRLEFLRSQLDNREDGYYYPFEAIELIVGMGTQDAGAVLESKLAESQRRSMSGKLLQQIQAGRREVEIQLRLRGSDAAAQAAELGEAFVSARGDRTFAGQGIQVWLIRQIAGRHLHELDGLLSQASEDVALEPRVRYEAEQAARELKGLPRSSDSARPFD